jgi:hypothetical protein
MTTIFMFSSERESVSDERPGRAPASRQAAADALAVSILMKASRSGFTTSAWVVHMPCGNFS